MDAFETLKELIQAKYDGVDALAQARRVVFPLVPNRLFKFRAASSYAIDNFDSDTLFCAKADTFNDPFDCSLTFQGPDPRLLMLRALKDVGLLTEARSVFIAESDAPLWEFAEIVGAIDSKMSAVKKLEFISDLEEVFYGPRDHLNSKIRQSCNICSLCENGHSLPMWAHYGDDHKGFAMEYDFSVLPAEHSVRESLWPVLYDDKMYDVTPQIFGRKVEEFNPLFLIGGALQKSRDWQYEKEWRIVLPVGAETSAANVSVPTPVALYLGALIDSTNERKLIDLARLKNVPVYRMVHSRTEFKMEPVRV